MCSCAALRHGLVAFSRLYPCDPWLCSLCSKTASPPRLKIVSHRESAGLCRSCRALKLAAKRNGQEGAAAWVLGCVGAASTPKAILGEVRFLEKLFFLSPQYWWCGKSRWNLLGRESNLPPVLPTCSAFLEPFIFWSVTYGLHMSFCRSSAAGKKPPTTTRKSINTCYSQTRGYRGSTVPAGKVKTKPPLRL